MSAIPLDAAQLESYLEDGYVVLQPTELDDAYHDRMHRAAVLTYGLAGGANSAGVPPYIAVIADNLRPRIPEVATLLDSPTINGAINSVLGEDWQIYPHDFIHESSDRGQGFHQDGNLPWNDRGHYRSHRPEWAMLFYYPQLTMLDSGPTEVLPGTQYWTSDFETTNGEWHRGDPVGRNLTAEQRALDSTDQQEFHRRLASLSFGEPTLQSTRIELPKGGVVLASYDLAHRGTGQQEGYDGRRFMYKFYLYRTRAPNLSGSPTVSSPTFKNSNIARIAEGNWSWLAGESEQDSLQSEPQSECSIDGLLSAETEVERIRIAYELGTDANRDLGLASDLCKLIAADSEGVRRAAGYAIGMVQNVDSGWFSGYLKDDRAPVRRAALLALRETQCRDEQTIAWLLDALERDSDDLVRSNAAYSLGLLSRAPNAVEFDRNRLISRLDHAVEPDNTTNGGMSRSTVRENVALALTMSQLNTAEVERIVHFAIAEHDRYAKSLLFIAIQRSARHLTESWLSGLIDYLTIHRYVN